MAEEKEEPRIEEVKEAKPQQLDGQRNCILAICCPPGSEGQRRALTEEIMEAFGWDDAMTAYATTPHTIADWILTHFDLAPAGSLQALKDAVRDHAREGYVKA